jgi:hypothetical protein
MAVWLSKADNAEYDIAQDGEPATILRWPNNALTRQRLDELIPDGAEILVDEASADQVLTIISRTTGDNARYRLHRFEVGFLPFSHYDLGGRQPHELYVRTAAPKADEVGNLVVLALLPPTDRELVQWKLHAANEIYLARFKAVGGRKAKIVAPATRGRDKVIDHREAAEIGLELQAA